MKKILDLDLALEEVVKKLRPIASGACGQSVDVFTDDFITSSHSVAPCYCTCCSDLGD